ncbi:MAG: hypothetical protein V4678_02755 [Patescibacteria group bacterium]
MSERINTRLDNFDANKAAAEKADFEDSLYGEAGSTDFSDEAHTRVQEADAYERQLESMGERGDMSAADHYDSEATNPDTRNTYMDGLHEQALEQNGEFDAAAEAEAQAFNEKMQSDPKVRRMQMIASDIASISASEFTSEDESRKTGALEDKQNKLEDLLLEFSEQSEIFSPEERDIITSRIIDMTEAAATQEYSSEAQQERMNERLGDEADEPVAEKSLLPNMSQEEIDIKLAAVRKAREEMEQAATEAAETSEEEAEKQAGVSDDGLELEEVEQPRTEGVSDDGLELTDDASTEVVEQLDDNQEAEESDENGTFTQRMRDRFGARAVGSKLSAWSATRNRAERSDDSRERSGKKRLIVGLGAVAAGAAGIFLANKYGIDLPFNGGGDSSGGGNRAERTGGNGMNWNDFDPSARRVTPGEGWNSTFQQMGIPKSEWADVLKTAGPKLGKLGEAYYDNTASEWRISRPGKLSEDALRVIAGSSRKNGVEL